MDKNPTVVNGRLVIRAYSKQQLAKAYHVCTRTITRWIAPFEEEVGQRQGLYFNLRQVAVIVDRLGPPDEEESKAA